MRQRTISSGFEKYSKQTRQEKFLSEMDQVIPWEALTKALEPHYPAPQGAGRRPKGLERMLRIYFMQQWYNLSDPAMEEALYNSRAMRGEGVARGGVAAGVDLGEERVPGETPFFSFAT